MAKPAEGRGITLIRPRRLLGLDEAPCEPRHTFHLARFLILRLCGLVYLTAFPILVNQGSALLGSKGLLPVSEFVVRTAAMAGVGR